MKIIFRLVFSLIFVLFTVTSADAQLMGKARMDSMLGKLATAKEDSQKVKLLIRIGVDLSDSEPNEGIKFGLKALELSKKIDWKIGECKAYTTLGMNYSSLNDTINMLDNYNMGIKLSDSIGYKTGLGSCLVNKGIYYRGNNRYNEAMKCYSKALETFQEISDRRRQAITLAAIASVYSDQGNYNMAGKNAMGAIAIYDSIHDNKGVANCSGTLGIIFFYQKNFSKALEYYNKALKVYEEMNDKRSMAIYEGDIANVYSEQREFVKANELYIKAIKTHNDIKDFGNEARELGNLGDDYSKLGDYQKALTCLKHGIELAEKINNIRALSMVQNQMGFCYVEMAVDTITKKTDSGIDSYNELTKELSINNMDIPSDKSAKLQKAIEYLTLSLENAKKVNAFDVIISSYNFLGEAYMLKNDFKTAYSYKQKYYNTNDSIISKEKVNLLEASMNYEMDNQRLTDSIKIVDKGKNDAIKLQRQENYTYFGIAGVVMLLIFSIFVVRNHRLVVIEKKRSEDLLLNILPVEVANELKETGKTLARNFDDVTVIFTDFVNFTSTSERLTPQQLIDELHMCFKHFDEVITKYGIEKIKTIGDAYLAVSGLPVYDPQHYYKAVEAAKEIIAFMNNRYATMGDASFQVRIGVHSGSVVAGIVGVKKFAYDVWGDTVNTAARMEQNSLPGKINISETTYNLVKDKIACEYRGEIEAKNKGAMKMYFVK